MTQISVQQLYDDTREKLELVWVAGRLGGTKQLTSDTVQKPSLALIGHLNFVHPNRVQILGSTEMDYLRTLDETSLDQSIRNLFSTELAAIVVANNEPVPAPLLNASDKSHTPLFTSKQSSAHLMNVLRHYLSDVLADSASRHGVFMEVQGTGVLITGDAAIGKSELALELVTRGHRLIADDIVEFYQVAPDTLEGRCPTLLQDFLEVRGLGVLNIRYLFGENAIKRKKNLKFIVSLKRQEEVKPQDEDRLQMREFSEMILGVNIPTVCIPVAAGRNIAVLVEVAVRNHIMLERGVNSTQEFIQRQQQRIAETTAPFPNSDSAS